MSVENEPGSLASAVVPTLSEVASKQLLAQFGVPMLDERLAADADEAVAAADTIGYPVVAKLCGDQRGQTRRVRRFGRANRNLMRVESAAKRIPP